MSLGNFDENNIESWYFGALSFDESQRLLQNEPTGIFLIRDSSRTPGEYVLCLREQTEVKQFPIHWKVLEGENHYYLRDDLNFPDIQSMLSFYKGNKFETTSLIRPIGKEVVVPLRPKTNKPKCRQADTWSMKSPRLRGNERDSAPPTFGQRQPLLPDSEDNEGQEESSEVVYARVIKNRSPSAYDNISLRLSVGDLIEVTQQSPTGQWIGILNGKKGVFPFSHVDIISESEYLQAKESN